MTRLLTRWDGEAFVPANQRVALACDKELVVGEVYEVEPRQERSMASHRQYFATLNDGFNNLREEWQWQFPTVEHLRKYCLIKSGYRDEATIVASSPKLAREIAEFSRPTDGYALIVTNGCVVTRYTAKSQSLKAMGRREFQKSKDDVLAALAGMIRVSPDDLRRNHAA